MAPKTSRPLPERYLLAYVLANVAPGIVALVRYGVESVTAAVGLLIVVLAVGMLLRSLWRGSRVAWSLLLFLDVGGVVAFAAAVDSLATAFAVIRVALLLSAPVREYVRGH